uniref:Uncharacterized protein n=1 Tax=Chromera velia CCMP2878 TaxID=1169474 RepID=A0A0G4HEI2_9ALVE|eukprot:Cvel_6554.t1-p1 / transcript=Cvel_6554.t1 / gene=Cvel_6554 / organism=Chromera_velia_CCMP2878 / gene_product=hypothetical protein / transcript_product=hypothetical protein / location=Cvel_scaffold322:93348-95730(-) / protein_length=112 / sequence_SO=supercontig / SO=protein_coding / is_pseudo=false
MFFGRFSWLRTGKYSCNPVLPLSARVESTLPRRSPEARRDFPETLTQRRRAFLFTHHLRAPHTERLFGRPSFFWLRFHWPHKSAKEETGTVDPSEENGVHLMIGIHVLPVRP